MEIKKHILSLSAAFLCILLMNGCSCNHQYEPASCSNVEICADCGDIQGTVQQNHTFSDWIPQEYVMVRSCSACGFQEVETISSEPKPGENETVLNPDHVGAWTSEWMEVYSSGIMYGPQPCRQWNMSFSFEVFPDGTFTAVLSDETLTGTLDVDSVSYYSGKYWYQTDSSHIMISISSDKLQLEDYMQLVSYSFRKTDDAYIARLQQELPYYMTLPLGTWKSYLETRQYENSGTLETEEYTDCTVTFCPDGTMQYFGFENLDEHNLETSWYFAGVHKNRNGEEYQYDFMDEETSDQKRFYIIPLHEPILYMEYTDSGCQIRIYLTRQEDGSR